jgi:gliding motility-associated-like protein
MGDGNTVNDTMGSYLYNSAGSYEVMQVINLGKCVDTATKYVLISDALLADFDYTMVDSQTVAFNNTTQGGDSWNWLFGDGNGSNTQNPNHHYNHGGSYNVWLVAVNNSGCSDSALQVIVIPNPIDTTVPSAIKDAIFIPNAFSPNGDGYNDIWQVFTNADINYFALTIYNRWGEKVYESNNQKQGWDGTYKGELQAPQSFVYMLTVVLQSGERRAFKGSMLLMK